MSLYSWRKVCYLHFFKIPTYGKRIDTASRSGGQADPASEVGKRAPFKDGRFVTGVALKGPFI